MYVLVYLPVFMWNAMNRVFSILTFMLSVLSWTAASAGVPVVKTGIDVLEERNFDVLEGKKIGLVTNPTGMDCNFRSTVDVLHEADGVELVAIFAPEHGVRGDVHAGDKVSGTVDPKTGIQVYSLYGATRKPLPQMLAGLDAIVYDIQDTGCRSYTFISTLGLVMQAAAESGVAVIVLDRPNPLGGMKVEGNLVQPGFFSFVGQYPVPYVYGMTVGELALYINGENLMGESCDLTVIPMQGWRRNMTYSETGLPWVAPSPHIPEPSSAFFYAATGILGELGLVSIGVGYTAPFQTIAAEWIDAEEFAERMNDAGLEGWKFRPVHYRPFYGFGSGKVMHGVQLHITDYASVSLTLPQFCAMKVLQEMYPDKFDVKSLSAAKVSMLNKVTGTDKVGKWIESGDFSSLVDFWSSSSETFRRESSSYYIY